MREVLGAGNDDVSVHDYLLGSSPPMIMSSAQHDLDRTPKESRNALA